MKRGLGKGLEALLGEGSSKISDTALSQGVVELVRINEIEPNSNQPRKRFDENALAELADSIARHGIIQPIIVRKHEDVYRIIAGERRWRAAKKAGLKEIPVLKKEATDKQTMEIALIENLQREDLNAIEEANAYRELIVDFNMTHGDLAEVVGKSRVEITNKMRLLKLPADVIEMIENADISAGHARALLALDSDEEISKTAKAVSEKQLNVRQTEQLIKKIKSRDTQHTKKITNIAEISDLQERLTKYFEAKVKIVQRKKGSKIIIDCHNDEALNSIIEKLEV